MLPLYAFTVTTVPFGSVAEVPVMDALLYTVISDDVTTAEKLAASAVAGSIVNSSAAIRASASPFRIHLLAFI